jgi:hypothetical protein
LNLESYIAKKEKEKEKEKKEKRGISKKNTIYL